MIVLEDLCVNGFTALRAPDDYETSEMIFHRLAVFACCELLAYARSQSRGGKFNFLAFISLLVQERRLFRLRRLRLPHARLASRDILQTQLESFKEPDGAECMTRRSLIAKRSTTGGRRLFTPSPGDFNALNHRDFALRNLLSRNIDGRICDVQFVSTDEEGEEHEAECGKNDFSPHIGSFSLFSLFPMPNMKNNQS